jgi:hypothetical protein
MAMEAGTSDACLIEARQWLQGREVVLGDGAVLSWANFDHPGYPYPEIAGLLLNLLAQDPGSDGDIRRKIATRLWRDVHQDGGIGRSGIRYVFDTSMALSGLIAQRRAAGELPDPALPTRLFDFIAAEIRARRAASTPTSGGGAHWSTSYGCHLLKTALAITAYGEEYGDARCPALIDQLIADLTPLFEDGRFRIHDHDDYSYLHSNCYALEGLLAIEAAAPRGWLRPLIRRGALWLARIQDECGGIRAGHNGFSAVGELRGDATAQSIRIWTLVDRAAFAREIAAAAEFLDGLRVDGGGYRYSPNSQDVNTWVTIFATQALTWANEGGNAACIV